MCERPCVSLLGSGSQFILSGTAGGVEGARSAFARNDRRELRGCFNSCPPRRQGSSQCAERTRVVRPHFVRSLDPGRGHGPRAVFNREAGCSGLICFLLLVARCQALIFLRSIRVPITGVAGEDRRERRDDVGHEPGKRAQHGRQQKLAT